MEKLGQWIKTAREAKGMSLFEIERATRIRSKFLTALEEGNLEQLPPRAYLKGMVRVYASYLGLDVGQALQMLEEGLGPESSYDIRQVAAPIQRQTIITTNLIGAVAVLAVVTFGVIFGVIFLRNLEQFAASNKVSDLTKITTSNLPSLSSTGSSSSSAPGSANAAPVQVATETPTPGPTASPTPLQEITVEVKITDRTWLQVDVDGRTVVQQIENPGTTKSWTAKDQIKMRAGNAGGVEITFNGKKQGVMGARGEVVDRTWTRP